MKQYTETYRIKISTEMKEMLYELKYRFSILPTKFIRQAIYEKIKRDMPVLIKKEKDYKYDCPF